MPALFLPEIETLAEDQPLLYEILFRIQQSIANIPINSGAATPAPTPAVDPSTGLPLTDASGNPLYTIPSTTDPSTGTSTSGSTSTSTGQLTAAQIASNEAGLYISTDPTGLASAAYIFGGTWQPITRIIRAGDASKAGVPGKTFLVPGMAVAQGVQFDNQGRPSSSFFTNAVDNTGVSLTNPLSQSGTSTAILVASTTWQFGGFAPVYNSGSVDPGMYGTFNVFFDDPQFIGGVAVYQAAAPGTAVQLKKRGRFYLGTITTSNAGGGTGGGGGNGGACFSGNTRVITEEGAKPISQIVPGERVLTLAGWFPVKKVLRHGFNGPVRNMGDMELVTLTHRFHRPGNIWIPARELFEKDGFYLGAVFNLEIDSDSSEDHIRCYTLANGMVAHNVKQY